MRTGTVLLVEDTPDDELLALRALRRAEPDVAVEIVRDGQEAVDRLLDGDALPDVAVLDLKLPKISGIDVIARVRADARARNVPIVVFSSSAEARDVAACYAAGANSYVQKPVDYRAFADALVDIVRYWTRRNVSGDGG